ncbi:MAG: hypothetical protein RL490_826 [Pseudomonadota bacterium]
MKIGTVMVRMIRRALAGVLASALMLTMALPTFAQAVDPRVLQQVQGQLGGNSASGAVDAARDAGEQRPAAAVPGARIDTREEQELRRAEARIGLKR